MIKSHLLWSHLVLQVLQNLSDGLQTQMLFTNLTIKQEFQVSVETYQGCQ